MYEYFEFVIVVVYVVYVLWKIVLKVVKFFIVVFRVYFFNCMEIIKKLKRWISVYYGCVVRIDLVGNFVCFFRLDFSV